MSAWHITLRDKEENHAHGCVIALCITITTDYNCSNDSAQMTVF